MLLCIFVFSSLFGVFISQQVDDKYIKTIHLHSSGGSGSAGGGKNSHRAKTLTNSQARDRHDSNGSSRARTLASQFSSGRGEYIFALIFMINFQCGCG